MYLFLYDSACIISLIFLNVNMLCVIFFQNHNILWLVHTAEADKVGVAVENFSKILHFCVFGSGKTGI